MTANEFRKMALALPGTVESAHMNHPDFRVEGRIFASLGYPDEFFGMVKLTPEQQRLFINKASGAFIACNGVWGRRGATNVHLASAAKGVVKTALEAAFRNVASQAVKKRRPLKKDENKMVKMKPVTTKTARRLVRLKPGTL